MAGKGQFSTEFLVIAALGIAVLVPLVFLLFGGKGGTSLAGQAHTIQHRVDDLCSQVATDIKTADRLGSDSFISHEYMVPAMVTTVEIDESSIAFKYNTERGPSEARCYLDVNLMLANEGPPLEIQGGMTLLRIASKGEFVCIGGQNSDCSASECRDGLDNDKNGCADFGLDSGCSSLTDPEESGSTYCCGNAVLEETEECDSSTIPFITCGEYYGNEDDWLGTLACHPAGTELACKIDVSACHQCGNGVINTVPQHPEECDGADLGGQTCAGLENMNFGDIACNSDCTLDTSGCSYCGDGLVEGDEICDDGNQFETDQCNANCLPTTCGDMVVQSPNGNGQQEVCDGSVGGMTCPDIGYPIDGVLGCTLGCQFDTKLCESVQPPDDPENFQT